MARPKLEKDYVTNLGVSIKVFGRDNESDRRSVIRRVAEALDSSFGGEDFFITDKDGVVWTFDSTAHGDGDLIGTTPRPQRAKTQPPGRKSTK